MHHIKENIIHAPFSILDLVKLPSLKGIYDSQEHLDTVLINSTVITFQ
jgi:hypothetical protein